MPLSRSKLYTLLFIACCAGYIWLYIGITTNKTETNPVEVCLIKQITNIPCPSCGSTRSVLALLHGELVQSVLINPFGLIIVFIMVVTPVWILMDIVTKRQSLYHFYHKMENVLKKPQFAIPLILLVILNWIWNIIKGL